MQISSSSISRKIFLVVGLLCFACAAGPAPVGGQPAASPAGDFTISANPTSLFIAIQSGDGFPFGEADGTLVLTGMNGFSGNVDLSCSVSGAGGQDQPTCFFPGAFPADQVFVDASNPPTSTGIEVDSVAPMCTPPDDSAAPITFPRYPGAFGIAALALLLVSTCLARFLPRTRRTKILRAAFFCAAVLAMSGCKNGPSAALTEGCPPGLGFTPGTPAGTYMLMVTATSGSLSHSVTIPVTVPAP